MVVAFKFSEHVVSEAMGASEPLALHPGGFVLDKDGKLSEVTWFTTTRQRAFEVDKVVTDREDQLTFVDKEGRKYTIRPLTLARYREKIKPRLEGDLDFEDQEEMEEYFGEHRYLR